MFTKLFPIAPHLYFISLKQSFIVTFKPKGENHLWGCQKFDRIYLIMGHSLKDKTPITKWIIELWVHPQLINETKNNKVVQLEILNIM
jgi:hypothetical protein